MYTTATVRLSGAIGAPYLLAIPRWTVAVALMAWSFVFAAMLNQLSQGLKRSLSGEASG